jgi:hypothetical protein
MHCVRFEMRLNQLLDDRALPDSDLELVEHARECPDCAELLGGHELLLHGLETCEAPSAGPDFAVRIAAEFAGNSRRRRWQRWAWSVAAVAAGLLLVFGVGHLFKDPAGTNPSPKIPLVNVQRGAANSGASAETRSPYYQTIVDRTAEWRQQLGGQRPEWVDQMADGLKPVAESMSAAFHALRRTFPGGDLPVRSSQFEPFSMPRVTVMA